MEIYFVFRNSRDRVRGKAQGPNFFFLNAFKTQSNPSNVLTIHHPLYATYTIKNAGVYDQLMLVLITYDF